ncbi:Crp/Fnr family transcriptional regulator [uncultured Jannaschia sp.]|uniref:Crp/Fnr family transcriptional regulator n=1 Tax=uncultured Jannaschia sp. TaxID=293347 RepID=UPI002619A2B2|nr:Crp/Fnr family transcriptional regulator [uncultured Jannaschia sp.]
MCDALILMPHLNHVDLQKHQSLEDPGKPIEDVCFPLSALVSVMVSGERTGCHVEVGLFGRDGMSGTTVLLGAGQSAYDISVAIAGTGLSLPATRFRELLEQRPTMRAHFLKYVHAAQVQMAHLALAQGHETLQPRLARWLLMAHDRVDGDGLELTHDYLSKALGVRRAGVTLAIHYLEGYGAIRAMRGHIRILDREGLLKVAGGSYGAPEAEYDRMFD